MGIVIDAWYLWKLGYDSDEAAEISQELTGPATDLEELAGETCEELAA